jgi:6-phosphogluconolactonase (cycloisomerase 2 family)
VATLPTGAPALVAFEPLGRFFYASVGGPSARSLSTFAFNAFDGGVTPVQGNVDGGLPAGASVSALVVDPSSHFVYAVDSVNGQVDVFAIDPVSGALSLIGQAATGQAPSSLVVVPRFQ